MIINKLKEIVKNILNNFGFDIIKTKEVPAKTLLGIRDMPIDVIIDIGANKGQFAKYILKIFPKAILYCFEPLPNVFKELEAWSSVKENNQITLFNVALDVKQGTAEILYHSEHSPSSSLLHTTKNCEAIYPFTALQKKVRVSVETLDNVLDDGTLDHAENILVKMDVQGYEDRVIKGGAGVLKKAKVCILEISLDALYKGQANFNDLSMMLYDFGFHYSGNLSQVYGEDGHCIYIDAVFIK